MDEKVKYFLFNFMIESLDLVKKLNKTFYRRAKRHNIYYNPPKKSWWNIFFG